MTNFLFGYQIRIDNLKAISLPSEIQGHLLLRLGMFDNTTKGLITASAGGSFEVEKLVAALKGLYPDGSVIPAPTAVANYHAPSTLLPLPRGGLFCDDCTRRNHAKADFCAFMRANGDAAKADELETSSHERFAVRLHGSKSPENDASSDFFNSDDPATFYIFQTDFTSAPTAKPCGIVDTGAFRTLIVEETLLSFMTVMKLDSV